MMILKAIDESVMSNPSTVSLSVDEDPLLQQPCHLQEDLAAFLKVLSGGRGELVGAAG